MSLQERLEAHGLTINTVQAERLPGTYTEDQTRLTEHSIAYRETFSRHVDLSMSSSVVHFGILITKDELDVAIKDAYGEEAYVQDTGFDYVSRTPVEESQTSALECEYKSIDLAVQGALDALGWKPEDVDGVFVGCGTPPEEEYKKEGFDEYADFIADRCGLTNANIRFSAYEACNSGGEALRRALEHKWKKVLVIAVEGMTRLAPGFDVNEADALSRYVFSNAVVATALVPGESITLLQDKEKHVMQKRVHVEDINGALAATMTYSMPPGIHHHETETSSRTRLPIPRRGQIDMVLKETGELFVNAMRPHVIDLYDEYASQYPIDNLQFAVSHHPQKIMLQTGFEKRMRIFKRPLRIPWVVRGGNPSAACTMNAFAELMAQMQRGKDIMVISYGAGTSGSLFMARVGGKTK